MYMGSTANVMFADPSIIKRITVKEFSKFPNRQAFGGVDKIPIFRSMVSVLTDDHWRHVRRLMTPTFSGGKLKQV